jgi:hypothetical protein
LGIGKGPGPFDNRLPDERIVPPLRVGSIHHYSLPVIVHKPPRFVPPLDRERLGWEHSVFTFIGWQEGKEADHSNVSLTSIGIVENKLNENPKFF